MDFSFILAIVLIVYGMFTLVGVAFKPNFYWNRGRIKEARERLGEQTTARLYAVVGLIMLVVGILVIAGVL